MFRKFISLTFLLLISLIASSQDLSFGILTDVHYADIPSAGPKEYSQSLTKLQECVDTMNSAGVDFIIELGDFIDRPQPPSEEKALIYLFRAEKVLQGFKGRIYHVFGNHDMDCITKEQFSGVAINTGINGNSGFYSFDCKGVHCVVLDAAFDSLGNDYCKGKYGWDDTHIPDHELKWLKNDLRRANAPVLVFIHQRLDGAGPYFIRNADRVRKILENSRKVSAVFQGHYHEGYYQLLNNIHYYTLRAMVDGGGKTGSSYAIVNVTPDVLKIGGYGNAQSISFGGSR